MFTVMHTKACKAKQQQQQEQNQINENIGKNKYEKSLVYHGTGKELSAHGKVPQKA